MDLIGARFVWERVDRYSTRPAKNHRSTYVLKRKLYIDHGWPDNFDSEGFREAREIWQAESVDAVTGERTSQVWV
jgi:hypothetical protein